VTQFPANPQRFDPYKNLKFRVKLGLPLQQLAQLEYTNGSLGALGLSGI
jgi:hypothetical protein